MRCFGGRFLAGIVYLAHHERKLRSSPRICIEGQSSCPNGAGGLERENIDAGEQDRVADVWSRIEEEDVGVLEKEKGGRRANRHDMKEEIGVGEWRPKIEHHSGGRREDASEEVPRVEDSLDHARAAFGAG